MTQARPVRAMTRPPVDGAAQQQRRRCSAVVGTPCAIDLNGAAKLRDHGNDRIRPAVEPRPSRNADQTVVESRRAGSPAHRWLAPWFACVSQPPASRTAMRGPSVGMSEISPPPASCRAVAVHRYRGLRMSCIPSLTGRDGLRLQCLRKTNVAKEFIVGIQVLQIAGWYFHRHRATARAPSLLPNCRRATPAACFAPSQWRLHRRAPRRVAPAPGLTSRRAANRRHCRRFQGHPGRRNASVRDTGLQWREYQLSPAVVRIRCRCPAATDEGRTGHPVSGGRRPCTWMRQCEFAAQ